MALDTHLTAKKWDPTRPRILVVACSDGRLQENVDDFLRTSLGIHRYDRLYAPGGPGALAPTAFDHLRADALQRECTALIRLHGIEEVLLLFHGPAPEGPDEAVCADYRRKYPSATAAEIRARQNADARDLLRSGYGWRDKVRARVFRGEIGADHAIRFVPIEVGER